MLLWLPASAKRTAVLHCHVNIDALDTRKQSIDSVSVNHEQQEDTLSTIADDNDFPTHDAVDVVGNMEPLAIQPPMLLTALPAETWLLSNNRNGQLHS